MGNYTCAYTSTLYALKGSNWLKYIKFSGKNSYETVKALSGSNYDCQAVIK
jgi:hypothetical protein